MAFGAQLPQQAFKHLQLAAVVLALMSDKVSKSEHEEGKGQRN